MKQLAKVVVGSRAFGYIYRITFSDGDTYIGKRKIGTQYDQIGVNYFGSGVLVKEKFQKVPHEEAIYEILEYAHSEDELDKLEIEYIKAHNPSLNCGRGGLGGTTYGFKGKEHSGATRQLIGEKGKGRTPPNKGKKASEEMKQKIREARAKQIITPEHKKHISESLAKTYAEGRREYTPLSEEARTQQRTKAQAWWTPERRQQQSLRMKGRTPWNKGKRISAPSL